MLMVKNRDLVTTSNVNFEAMNIEEKYYEILRPYVSSDDCDEVIEKLLNLHSVSDSLPVVCTMEDERGELANGCRISIEYAGELITEQAKKLKAFGDFIDEYNSNYR